MKYFWACALILGLSVIIWFCMVAVILIIDIPGGFGGSVIKLHTLLIDVQRICQHQPKLCRK